MGWQTKRIVKKSYNGIVSDVFGVKWERETDTIMKTLYYQKKSLGKQHPQHRLSKTLSIHCFVCLQKSMPVSTGVAEHDKCVIFRAKGWRTQDLNRRGGLREKIHTHLHRKLLPSHFSSVGRQTTLLLLCLHCSWTKCLKKNNMEHSFRKFISF